MKKRQKYIKTLIINLKNQCQLFILLFVSSDIKFIRECLAQSSKVWYFSFHVLSAKFRKIFNIACKKGSEIPRKALKAHRGLSNASSIFSSHLFSSQNYRSLFTLYFVYGIHSIQTIMLLSRLMPNNWLSIIISELDNMQCTVSVTNLFERDRSR